MFFLRPQWSLAGLVLLVTGTFPSHASAQVQQFQLGTLRKSMMREPGKLGLLHGISEQCLAAGTLLDLTSTALVLDHPTVALRTDGTVLGHFYGREVGWASVFGPRDTGAVVAANLALSAGVGVLSRRIYRLGGAWRFVAIVLDVAKAADSAIAGGGNLRFRSGINDRLRLATHYKEEFSWRP